MQNVDQDYFIDRMVYYSTFPIREQAKRGNWDFKLNHIYTIGILNFDYYKNSDEPHHEAKLIDTATYEIFYERLTYITIELPKFNKTEDELVTLYDKRLFVLRNMSKLMSKPAALQENVFVSLFRHAEIDRMKPNMRMQYEKALFDLNDINNSNIKCFREGKEEGLKHGLAEGEKNKALEIARNLKASGVATEIIMQSTGLSAENIENL